MSWICLPMGMYMPALRPPHTVEKGDDRLLQIRSRRKIDLERLRNELLPELGETIRIPHTDYEYRAYCTHQQWAQAMYLAAMDIDYIKFKEQSEKRYGDHQLHNCYTRMWSTVFSALSTKKHQSDYWSWQRETLDKVTGRSGKGKGKHRQAGQSRWSAEATSSTGKRWWEDLDEGPRTRSDTPLLRDMIDTQFGITGDDIQRMAGTRGYSGDEEIDAVLADWDEQQPGNEIPVTRRPNGTIDHSHCTHENTKNARRRCRKAANRNN